MGSPMDLAEPLVTGADPAQPEAPAAAGDAAPPPPPAADEHDWLTGVASPGLPPMFVHGAPAPGTEAAEAADDPHEDAAADVVQPAPATVAEEAAAEEAAAPEVAEEQQLAEGAAAQEAPDPAQPSQQQQQQPSPPAALATAPRPPAALHFVQHQCAPAGERQFLACSVDVRLQQCVLLTHTHTPAFLPPSLTPDVIPTTSARRRAAPASAATAGCCWTARGAGTWRSTHCRLLDRNRRSSMQRCAAAWGSRQWPWSVAACACAVLAVLAAAACTRAQSCLTAGALPPARWPAGAALCHCARTGDQPALRGGGIS